MIKAANKATLAIVFVTIIGAVNAGYGDFYSEKYTAQMKVNGNWVDLDNLWCLEQKKQELCTATDGNEDTCSTRWDWPNTITSDDGRIKLERHGSRKEKRCGKRDFCDNSSQTFTDKFTLYQAQNEKFNECGQTEVSSIWSRRNLRRETANKDQDMMETTAEGEN